MQQKFSDDDNKTHPMRARQAWQILVGKAMNRQTVTYSQLSKLMYGKELPWVLSEILGHIAFYCISKDLPQLNVLVVGLGRGTPGKDIPADPSDIDVFREAVYGTDWYDIVPPTEHDLKAAYDEG